MPLTSHSLTNTTCTFIFKNSITGTSYVYDFKFCTSFITKLVHSSYTKIDLKQFLMTYRSNNHYLKCNNQRGQLFNIPRERLSWLHRKSEYGFTILGNVIYWYINREEFVWFKQHVYRKKVQRQSKTFTSTNHT